MLHRLPDPRPSRSRRHRRTKWHAAAGVTFGSGGGGDNDEDDAPGAPLEGPVPRLHPRTRDMRRQGLDGGGTMKLIDDSWKDKKVLKYP